MFYLLAIVLSILFGAAAVAVVAVASPRLIDNDIIMAGTFLVVAFLTLVGAVEAMRRYTARRPVKEPQGRRTRS